MNICVVNGSPKPEKSTSEILIGYMIKKLENQGNLPYDTSCTTIVETGKGELTDGDYVAMCSCDALIFAFPLYIDSIPSHLLRIMQRVKEIDFFNKNTIVYGLINGAFYEGIQSSIAVEQLKLWCEDAGVHWGQALAVGGGEMQPFIQDIPLKYGGPNKTFGIALDSFTFHILHGMSEEDIFVTPDWPHFLWKIQGSLLYWYPRAKKNGLKRKDLYNRP